MKNIYAVYDIVARELVGPLLTFDRDEAAIRIFTDALADKQLTIGQHPADYELLRLGEIDTSKPTLQGALVDTVITGKQWLALQEKNTGA